jgi:NAD+ kinase
VNDAGNDAVPATGDDAVGEKGRDPTPLPPRRVLLVSHPGRRAARDAAQLLCARLAAAGVRVRLLDIEAGELGLDPAVATEKVPVSSEAASGCELVVVLGGDGTILRGAELARPSRVPLLGVNLGHVGFLAEAESDDLDTTVDQIVHRRWTVEERLTLDVRVLADGELVHAGWALNEASVEKAARQRMLEVLVEVDGRPLSRWAGDGVVCATPTGSTAYAFSAGGPVVWPDLAALLLVPLSAHALFARPLVVSPSSVVAVTLLEGLRGDGVLWCDGRRTYDVPPGTRIEVRRGDPPVLLARLHEAPFTDRLVRKFGLPTTGWRGARHVSD